MPKWLIQVFISIGIGVAGQLLFKEGASRLDVSVNGIGGPLQLIWRMISNPTIFFGLVCYGISTVFWILVLKDKDLSLVYPMLACSYILVLLFSWLIRHEPISPGRWLGALIISIGVILISRS